MKAYVPTEKGKTMKLREKLINQYLPLWAKETVLRDNRVLRMENEMLRQKISELESWINGIQYGLKYSRGSKRDGDGNG